MRPIKSKRIDEDNDITIVFRDTRLILFHRDKQSERVMHEMHIAINIRWEKKTLDWIKIHFYYSVSKVESIRCCDDYIIIR